ncbi:MAG: rRNA pseudouridine synthase [Candidatus Omnitrophica bacterium]|nr:rRNA pseudouridine synthase [Candidatus Omnitrophota bacterium]
MRLNLYIAKSGIASRRSADQLVSSGKVTINDCRVDKPFIKVRDNDQVRVSGELIKLKEYSYLLFNKPKGVTTTLSDRFANKTVVDFIPKKYHGLYPVGRLDKNSHGLLILTNDGDFCYKLTHPKFSVEKEYLIKLRGALKFPDRQKAKQGVRDAGDLLKVKKIMMLSRDKENTLCKVIISEGKKRHLRRLFKQLGYRVLDLKRVRVGGLVIGSLKTGKYRILAEAELEKALAG